MAEIEFKDKGLKKLLDSVKGLDKMHVKVGVLASRGGNERTETGMTLIELMATHEFGAPSAGIPERRPIRKTFEDKEDELVELQEKLAKMVVTNHLEPKKALTVIGSWAATEIKKTITEGPHLTPALKPATIARKGSDRPLVDTGRLVGAVAYEVVEDE